MRKTNKTIRDGFRKPTDRGVTQILLEVHKVLQYIIQPHISYKVTIETLRYLGVDETVLTLVERMIAEGKINPNTKFEERELRAAVVEEIDPIEEISRNLRNPSKNSST